MGFLDFFKKAANEIIIVKTIKNSWEFSSIIRGRDRYQDILEILYNDGGGINNSEVDKHIRIFKEPDNKYDSKAIYVTYKNKKIGYISKDRLEFLENIRQVTNVKLRPFKYKGLYSAEISFDY